MTRTETLLLALALLGAAMVLTYLDQGLIWRTPWMH